jgi:cellulose synthase operon protein C
MKKAATSKKRVKKRAAALLALLLAVAAASACFFVARRAAASKDEGGARKGDEVERLIDSALYARAEFFGARARVPYPTGEARNRLAELLAQRPKEPRVLLALARADEKLGRYDLAESETEEYASLAGESFGALAELADFQHRRALFEREAATLEKMLAAAPADDHAAVLERLTRLAESQRIARYLSPEFFERVIADRPTDFRVVAEYIGRLASEKKTAYALEAVRRYREGFPAHRRYFLEKEVSILDAAKRAREAEAVYRAAFDPFWPDSLSEKFYDFLRDHDRYRAYESELRQSFERDPSDFQTAVRLFHFRKHDYRETPDGIFARVERARAARGVEWKPEELATAARLLIEEGDGDSASRFLYTLVARGRLEKGSPERAKVLYQLFELLSDAGGERLALTRGDLEFYRDVASSDPQPGITGGLLSLIFSDTNPPRELKREGEEAVEFFNRAAAYRIFNAYKEENPTSPELAQMYLDIVRLYTAAKEPEVAAPALAEFERRYADAPHYAEVALKLADCYVLLGRHEEERALYQHVLDRLGQHRDAKAPLVPVSPQSASDALSEPTEIKPALEEYPPKSNQGIKATDEDAQDDDDYYRRSNSYRDFMSPDEDRWQTSEGDAGAGDAAEGVDESSGVEESDDKESGGAHDGDGRGGDERARGKSSRAGVTYSDVLARYVSSLAAENRTEEILSLYAGEIRKYPGEQGLYEQMLQWLGQTNLFDEQTRVYKDALARFPTERWRDRLARWMLRRERRRDFESYSRELISKLEDDEAERYLEKFAGASAGADDSGFESNFYLGLYSLAHERFPGDLRFVQGLLNFYAAHKRWDEYQKLLAEYYFVSPEIRERFLARLAEQGELRARLDAARALLQKGGADLKTVGADLKNVGGMYLKAVGGAELKSFGGADSSGVGSEAVVASLPYKLFRADAAALLSNYEEAVDAYRELNRLYPNSPEFAERLVSFTRSLGQHDRKFLEEAAATALALADARPAEAAPRTRAGEILAELGDYRRARAEWSQLVALAPGEPDSYLEAATVNWDYFQYADALEIINSLRRESGDHAAYAFEAGAILEAEHKLPAAVGEYVKALDPEATGYTRARRRLAVLFKRPGAPELVAASFARERSARAPGVALGYAELLKEVGRWDEASALLAREVAHSGDEEFIGSAKELFSDAKDTGGERACLNRLVQLSRSPRRVISYSLQLAESYGSGERASAASVLRGLAARFPFNYGVVLEASSFYRRLGFTEDSLGLLRAGAARGRGRYRREFERRLAARLLELNRVAESRRVLEAMQTEDPLDLGVFRELARVYVRASDGAALKAAFGKTVEALKAEDADPRETREQVADLRRALVGAFTQMRDYRAAMEQHVEIVNHDPEDEENVDAAIAYAKRYGGADELLAYYEKTARQAYKNYRWDVVLARIHEARGDLSAAARSYREAIDDQPEMVELHAALAEVCVKAGDYDAALKSLSRAAELSNDDPQYLRRTAEVLEKAGRAAEAQAVRQKLPAPQTPKRETARDLFAAAASNLSGDRAQAVEEYRKAFDALAADPYKQDLRASEVAAYTRAVRDAEPLGRIFERLWAFREKLTADASREDGTNAGKARSMLITLDGALPDAVGSLARERATGDELAALFASLREKADASLRAPDAYGTLGLLENLEHRAGFAALEERILAGQKDAARDAGDSQNFHSRLRSLASFYADAGQYARAVELLETESRKDSARDDFDYAALVADYARLAGDPARELDALRSYYGRPRVTSILPDDSLVARYFELLYDSGEQGREELRQRAQGASPFGLQLVNFLIARGERELAHEAVAHVRLPPQWKLARDAELSLALREFDARGAGYFDAALGPATVGELLAARGAGVAPLGGDDWSHLEETYGRWLYLSGAGVGTDGANRANDANRTDNSNRTNGANRANESNRVKARAALPAIVESRPRDAGAQAALGRWYLAQKDARAALEHLTVALEESPGDARTLADLGSAYFLAGERAQAEAAWSKLVVGDDPATDSCVLYLKTLAARGLGPEAREKLLPVAAKKLKEAGESYPSNKKFAEAKTLVAALASSFAPAPGADAEDADAQQSAGTNDGDARQALPKSLEEARAALLRKLCDAAEDEKEIARMVVEDGLVGRHQLGDFYSILVERPEESDGYSGDYEFETFAQNAFGVGDVEEAFDHANSFRAGEPSGERVGWQKKYLDYLLEEGRYAEAARLIASVESEISRRYARPGWLRLAKVRLELRGGRVAQAVADLKHYVGADVSEGVAKVSAPSAERLSESVALLKSERRDAEAAQLLEAAYTQSLALGRFEASSFAGLARLAFERGDAERGLKLLRLLTALADDATKDEAAAEVAALPDVSRRFNALAHAELPEQSNDIARAEALKLAAETASSFGRYAEAAEFRLRLAADSPGDYANRVELARVLAACGKFEDGAAQLASIVADRDVPRAMRWRAVWVAPEVFGGREQLWASLARSAGADVEMAAAVKARELAAEGRAPEAAELLRPVADADPNPLLEFFLGVLDEQGRRTGDADEAFDAAFRSQADDEVSTAFGADEESALRKLIRLRAAAGRPLAALKLASTDKELLSGAGVAGGEGVEKKVGAGDGEDEAGEGASASAGMTAVSLLTLDERTSIRRNASAAELLGLLSAAAERLKDYDKAVEFERARLSRLAGDERRASRQRVARLVILRKSAEAQKPPLVVDSSTVAQR